MFDKNRPGVLDLVAADGVLDVRAVRQRHMQRRLDVVPVEVRRHLVVDARIVLAPHSAACSAAACTGERGSREPALLAPLWSWLCGWRQVATANGETPVQVRTATDKTHNLGC